MIRMMHRQLLNFTLVGGIGFVVDAGVLTALTALWGWDVYLARLLSFVLATLATWWLNRMRTFALPAGGPLAAHVGEYARYVSVQVGGGLINLAVFSALILLEPRLRPLPVLPLAVGSGVALFWNYFGARLWVYRVQR